MMPLSPTLFLVAASASVVSDVRVRPLSRAQRLKDLDPETRAKQRRGDATAAFIAHAGYTAHRQAPGKSAWPFPLDADCEALARIGVDLGIVTDALPDEGAIYLRYSQPGQRCMRASIVLWAVIVPPMEQYGWTYDCHVIEGVTVRRARRAWVTCAPELGDRFLTWVDLDRRNETTRLSSKQAA
jgi:hypothetical protein